MQNHITGNMWYSLFSVLAYSAGGLIFYLEARRKNYYSEQLLYVVFAALSGALIGSRLGSALFVYRNYFVKDPLVLLSPVAGGKTIVGGLIGGYLGVIIAKKILKLKRSTGDLFAPGLALGIGIGRIGCFLNGCCFGTITNVPWAVNIKGVLRHPAQIYESLFGIALFIFLWRIRKSVRKEGDLFKIFILAYTFFRFWIEFLRADRVLVFFSLSIAQVISGLFFVMVVMYFMLNRTGRCCEKSG